MAHQESSVGDGEEESDTEDDPLDALMAGIIGPCYVTLIIAYMLPLQQTFMKENYHGNGYHSNMTLVTNANKCFFKHH